MSSDSDFTWLATRLRESGKTVYGMGQRKTPESLPAPCDKFIFLEVLRDQDEQPDAVRRASTDGRRAGPDLRREPLIRGRDRLTSQDGRRGGCSGGWVNGRRPPVPRRWARSPRSYGLSERQRPRDAPGDRLEVDQKAGRPPRARLVAPTAAKADRQDSGAACRRADAKAAAKKA